MFIGSILTSGHSQCQLNLALDAHSCVRRSESCNVVLDLVYSVDRVTHATELTLKLLLILKMLNRQTASQKCMSRGLLVNKTACRSIKF